MDPHSITTIAVFAIVTTGVVASMIAQAWAQRAKAAAGESPKLREMEQRLLRMEQAIDSIAVEVERSAEANRYTAKLLTDNLQRLGPAQQTERAAQR